jgi:hypothetical protein
MTILGWNQTANATRRMITRAGSHFVSRLEFRNVRYGETDNSDDDIIIDQVITGSIGRAAAGKVPSLAFA